MGRTSHGEKHWLLYIARSVRRGERRAKYYQIPQDPKDRVYTAFEANGKLYQYRRLLFGVTNRVSAFQRIIDGIISQNSLQCTFAYLDNITIGGTSKADYDQNLKRFLDAASQLNLTFNEAKSVVAVPQIDILGTGFQTAWSNLTRNVYVH